MAQSVRAHQLRARPCAGNGRAVFPAHFLVLSVMNHQRGRYRAGVADANCRDVEGRPRHAQPALAVALHARQYPGPDAELPRQSRGGLMHVGRRADHHGGLQVQAFAHSQRQCGAAERMCNHSVDRAGVPCRGQ